MQSFLRFHNFPDLAIFTNVNMKFEWHTISNNIIKLHYPEASLVNWGFEYPIKIGILSIIPVIPHQGWHTSNYVCCLHRVLWMHISSQFHRNETSIFYTTSTEWDIIHIINSITALKEILQFWKIYTLVVPVNYIRKFVTTIFAWETISIFYLFYLIII